MTASFGLSNVRTGCHGVEARGVACVLHLDEIAEFVLELLVDGLRAADEAHTRQAVAPFIERIAGGFDCLRMTRQPG